jgi:hypothetical protein
MKMSLEDLITKCLSETQAFQNGSYAIDKADKTAAMFLEAQLRLGYYLEEVELNAKNLKNQITKIEAEKYFEYKLANTGKVTEGVLTNSVAKDDAVVLAKKLAAEAESTLKKWAYISNTLKDAHVFFRTVAKGNKSNDWGQ